MKRAAAVFIVVAVAVICGPKVWATDHGFIFGTVVTDRGDEYTGRIRWDKNEGFWDDIIDATKYDEDRYESRPNRKRRIKIFGLTIGTDGDFWDWSSSSQIRFGHIQRIEPRSRGRATVTLKNGEKVRFEDSGSDIGSGVRGIQVDVEDEGIIELDWNDLERVEFFPEPDDYRPTEPDVERLYGHVQTETGEDFVGFICWDADEIYSTDILDGEEHNLDREIKFGTIERIEKHSRKASMVTLKSGREMKLSGTNDVDSDNRGIFIVLADLGQVKVNWDEFESLTFMSPPPGAMLTYDRFDGGRPLLGTVTDEDGKDYRGHIVWDNDERFTWEFLNGEDDDLEYDVEFGQILSIERRSGRSAIVHLRDGKQLRLRGSNDVDDDNKGIFVETDDGDVVELYWDEFEKVAFEF
jgi:hypothetical protein